MTILLKLLLAHLLGDFVLQPSAMVKQKESRKLKAPYLYVHVLLHGILAAVLVWHPGFWPYAVALALSHFMIDAAKLYLQRFRYRRLLFGLDQLLHLGVIIAIWIIWREEPLDFGWLFTDEKWLFYTTFVFLTIPASVIIKIFISAWTPEKHGERSLENAGNWIGILERLLIFGFLIAGKWEAIGFLLAAKSVFRFGDLRDSTDRKLTEYILIGTLTSFSLAILTGIFYLQVQKALLHDPAENKAGVSTERLMHPEE